MTPDGKPAPPRVGNCETYWTKPPPEQSARCAWWVERITVHGWRPSRRVNGLGYYSSSAYYGVHIWEYLNVISPLLQSFANPSTATPPTDTVTR